MADIISVICAVLFTYIFSGFMIAIMSEPTESLSKKERRRLFGLLVLIWPWVILMMLIELIRTTYHKWFK